MHGLIHVVVTVRIEERKKLSNFDLLLQKFPLVFIINRKSHLTVAEATVRAILLTKAVYAVRVLPIDMIIVQQH